MDQIVRVHVDLETLDTAHTAKVLSIGACCGEDTYYNEIDLSMYGEQFTESESTVAWWKQQGGFKPSMAPVSPHAAVVGLCGFITSCRAKKPGDLEVWANAPSFDCAILNHHLQVFSLQAPWRFYQERDVRTVKALSDAMKLPIRQKANPHNALTDAQNQQAVIDSIYATLADRCQRANEAR